MIAGTAWMGKARLARAFPLHRYYVVEVYVTMTGGAKGVGRWKGPALETLG